MIKIINYLLQSIFIYFSFLLSRIIGLRLSRKIFSNFFSYIGPIFKSKKILDKNLNNFANTVSNANKAQIINNMWKNYGMTFIEYIFLDKFRNSNQHIKIKDENNLSRIKQENKPVIFVSGHFANFELMSMEITKKIFLWLLFIGL